MKMPPLIARDLAVISRCARDMVAALVSLRNGTQAHIVAERERGATEFPEVEVWRETARQHIRVRPVLRNILR